MSRALLGYFSKLSREQPDMDKQRELAEILWAIDAIGKNAKICFGRQTSL